MFQDGLIISSEQHLILNPGDEKVLDGRTLDRGS